MGTACATVRHVPIKSGVVLKPGEMFVAQIEASRTIEIGWTAVQAKSCTTNCVEASQVGGNSHFGFATALGGSKTYEPAGGKVAIEYKNISQEPVTIDVFRIVRICDAESCRFLDNTQKGHTLVFKIDELKSITTSKDESYSVISGVAQSGRPFRFYAVWFTDDKNFMNLEKGCTTWIKRYIDNHTPREQYRPYIIAGQNVGNGDRIVLRSIDDCVPRADHFGVDPEKVFK
ncbi:MAG TPA: hypothetical protein VGI45_02115 [Terracidiphilus sp.]|jgi:hypothetical protein